MVQLHDHNYRFKIMVIQIVINIQTLLHTFIEIFLRIILSYKLNCDHNSYLQKVNTKQVG